MGAQGNGDQGVAAARAVSAGAGVGKAREECLRGEQCGYFNRCLSETFARAFEVLALGVCIQSVGAQALQSGRRESRESTEQIVLTTLADKVFTPSRVEIMLRELRTRQDAARSAEDARFQQLTRELKEIDMGITRLYEAVEKGLLPLDTTLQERAQKLQARRQDVLVASAALRDKWEVPLNRLTPAHVQKFTRALRSRLLDTASGFGKAYLNLLVDEIRLNGSELHIQGSYRALARAVSLSKEGKLGNVPSFVPEWRARQDSNPRPPGS